MTMQDITREALGKAEMPIWKMALISVYMENKSNKKIVRAFEEVFDRIGQLEAINGIMKQK